MNFIIAIFIFSGLLIGIVLTLAPTLALWLLLTMSMLVSGTVIYFFPQFSTIQWSVALISFALLLRALPTMLIQERVKNGRSPAFFKLFIILLGSVIITTILNRHYTETLVSAKNFFQFWSIPLVLYFVIKEEKTTLAIMKAFLWIAALQIPFVVIQFLFFQGKFPGDSITGTFGGQIRGGGPNGALAIFLTVQIAVLLALMLRNKLSWKLTILLSAILASPILLTNTRAILFFFIVLLIFFFGRNIFKRPFISITGGIIVAILLSTIMLYHYKHAWQYNYAHRQPKDVPTYLTNLIKNNFTITGRKRLNRTTVITFWWQENVSLHGPVKIMFGHGLGAAKYSGIIKGHVQKKRQYDGKRIGFTVLARLLWDIGIIGTACYIMIFVSAFFTSRRLKLSEQLPKVHVPYMQVAQLTTLFLLMSIPYHLYLINIQSFNAFAMFILGYIAFWNKRLSPPVQAEQTQPASEGL